MADNIILFKWYNTRNTFNSELENNKISEGDLCLIKDTQDIYNHNTNFHIYSESEIKGIIENNRDIYKIILSESGETLDSDTYTDLTNAITEGYLVLISMDNGSTYSVVTNTLNVGSELILEWISVKYSDTGITQYVNYKVTINASDLSYNCLFNSFELKSNGDGSKYLSDNGTYRPAINWSVLLGIPIIQPDGSEKLLLNRSGLTWFDLIRYVTNTELTDEEIVETYVDSEGYIYFPEYSSNLYDENNEKVTFDSELNSSKYVLDILTITIIDLDENPITVNFNYNLTTYDIVRYAFLDLSLTNDEIDTNYVQENGYIESDNGVCIVTSQGDCVKITDNVIPKEYYLSAWMEFAIFSHGNGETIWLDYTHDMTGYDLVRLMLQVPDASNELIDEEFKDPEGYLTFFGMCIYNLFGNKLKLSDKILVCIYDTINDDYKYTYILGFPTFYIMLNGNKTEVEYNPNLTIYDVVRMLLEDESLTDEFIEQNYVNSDFEIVVNDKRLEYALISNENDYLVSYNDDSVMSGATYSFNSMLPT